MTKHIDDLPSDPETVACSAPDLHAHESLGECDAWRCACGNEGYLDGFGLLMTNGDTTDDPAAWDTDNLKCGFCGRTFTAQGIVVAGPNKFQVVEEVDVEGETTIELLADGLTEREALEYGSRLAAADRDGMHYVRPRLMAR